MAKLIPGVNDLATINPELVADWHPTLNGELTPAMVTPGSNKKVWWRCERGHEWQATPNDRTRGSKCPICSNRKVLAGYNDLATINPELAKEWHPTKNGEVTPEMVSARSNRYAWWLGTCGHEWRARIADRQNTGCPTCASKIVLAGYNDLTTTNPELVKEWHPMKNGKLTPEMVTAGSDKTVWWLGACGHEWEASISSRQRGRGCPVCDSKSVQVGNNDLATHNPELVAEWHPTKNGTLTPEMVTAGSEKKVWWLGTCGHEWEAIIKDRHGGHNCPICKGKGHYNKKNAFLGGI